jgi:hypothetical protein
MNLFISPLLKGLGSGPAIRVPFCKEKPIARCSKEEKTKKDL